MTTYDKRELEIVELSPDTHKEIGYFKNLKEACSIRGVTKQALHQAIVEGSVCAGSRWILRRFYAPVE